MRPAKNTCWLEREHLRWSEATVSVPNEATAYAAKPIKSHCFDYDHVLILPRLRCGSRRPPLQQASARWVRLG